MPRSFLVKHQKSDDEEGHGPSVPAKTSIGERASQTISLPPPLIMIQRGNHPLTLTPRHLMAPVSKVELPSLIKIEPQVIERSISEYYRATLENNEEEPRRNPPNFVSIPGTKTRQSLSTSTPSRRSSSSPIPNETETIANQPHGMCAYSHRVEDYEWRLALPKNGDLDLREFFETDCSSQGEQRYAMHGVNCNRLENNFSYPSVLALDPRRENSHLPASHFLVSENERFLSRYHGLELSPSKVNGTNIVFLTNSRAHHTSVFQPMLIPEHKVKVEQEVEERDELPHIKIKVEDEPQPFRFKDVNEVQITRVCLLDESCSSMLSLSDSEHKETDPDLNAAYLGTSENSTDVIVSKATEESPPDVTKRVHPRKYRYTCDVCGKSFSRSNTLTTHKRIHTGDKPFHCEQCGRAFRQPGNLTRHRLTHTTVKPYVCPQCNKAFNRASNLHTHMRTHTNYKPFVCDFCSKGFHQKIDMKIHRYTHTGEKPHKCQKCGRGFKQLTHLTYHMRTHSEERLYKCEFCDKGFNQKGNLQAHIYGHTGERPFKCDICAKGFTLASTLNTHKRTHASKKPFECQFCGKSFYQKNALKTHYIASHPFANGISLL